MRSPMLLLLGCLVALRAHGEPASHEAVPERMVVVSSAEAMRDALVRFANAELAASHLHLEEAGARLTVLGRIEPGQAMIVHPRWQMPAGRPSLPLRFELRPVATGGATHAPVHATLSVALTRDTWVATRPIARGEAMTCADLQLERRALSSMASDALPVECAIAPQAVALRPIGKGDPIRAADAGAAPDVMARGTVQLQVTNGRIVIETQAVALADARVGESLRVRVPGRSQHLAARVTGRGTAELTEVSR